MLGGLKNWSPYFQSFCYTEKCIGNGEEKGCSDQFFLKLDGYEILSLENVIQTIQCTDSQICFA